MGKHFIDPNKLCMGCMAELPQVMEVCPLCNFSKTSYEKPKNGLPLETILNGKYLIGRVIGIGGFGITYVGWNLYQGKKVCIKEYFPREVAVRNSMATNYTEQLAVSVLCEQNQTGIDTVEWSKAREYFTRGLASYMREAETLSKFYLMPGIVSVRDRFEDNYTSYIVMEYIDGINMKQYAKSKGGTLKPEEVFSLLKNVMKALNEVHKCNIIHRDISPDNIMITRTLEAKLIDFGASQDYENMEKSLVLLKQGYAPLEQYSKNGNHGPWSDIYSLCACMYYLMTGVRIQEAEERKEEDKVLALKDLGVEISETQNNAISKGLNLEIEGRYQSIADLYFDLYGETI